MAWLPPKTNWTSSDTVTKEDLNRINNNLKHLYDKIYIADDTATMNPINLAPGQSAVFGKVPVLELIESSWFYYFDGNRNYYFEDEGWQRGREYQITWDGDRVIFTNTSTVTASFSLMYRYKRKVWQETF